MNRNREIASKNKTDLRTLEDMYVNDKIDNLPKLVEERKKQLTDEIEEYYDQCKTKKYTKDGNSYEIVNISPIIIQRYFFKSINPIGNREPDYNAEKLAIVWDLYNEIILQINMKLGEYIPTITGFCTFAGITTATFKTYKKSNDIDLRTISEKINDSCYDANITLAQRGELKERSTIYRMKSEQEKAEKEQPVVHIHSDSVDLNAIANRLQELKDFDKRKNNIIEVQNIEK